MKSILTTIMSIVSLCSIAQTGLYQTIEQNGLETEYKEFYRIKKGETAGTTYVNTEGERYWVKASILKSESGEKIGYELTKSEGGSSLTKADELSRYTVAKGYPNVSYLYDTYKMTGVIATGDFIIKLEGISKDGLSFEDIESVFVKKQVKEKKKTEVENSEPNKKSKFLNNLKKAALNAGDLGMSLEAKKLKSVDIYQIAKDYLVAMKAKQASYILSSKDNAEIAKIAAIKKAKYDKIKKANDAYWASPEGQAHYKSYGNNSNSKNEYYYIKNSTNNPVKVGNGSTNHLNSGSTYKVKCGTPIYRYQLNSSKTTWQKSSLISDGKNVCGKTINF